ncbi:MAG TPA: hemerythrin domain-containing protein [Oligoflexia bacterium]|nr:hemerythrin domain-containing protein [Oligoflexia bacterium]HMR25826.1 hemerythrin domain-containing protein [Oligoflexia bacterium]
MKRSDELRPLSVEHHHNLFQVFQIRKAIKGELKVDQVVTKLLNEWEKVIEPHFEIEESILIPAYKNSSDSNVGLMDTFYDQHRELRRCFSNLKDKTKRFSRDLLTNLADLLEKHIRFEERELFPAVEASLSFSQMQMVGRMLNEKCVDYDQNVSK